MKNFFAVTICAALLMLNAVVQAADEPKISADAAVLVEASTGRILYERNSDARREPASMTKMLTCLLALEHLKPTDEVPVSRATIYTEDNTLAWGEGDILSAWDMMTAVMLVSENGGAVALAQAVGGNVQGFAEMMNERAKSIGCKDSHFANPNGLPAPNHYSTAADMARIAVSCMKNADFRKLVETQRTSIRWLKPKDKWAELNNTNHLLGKYKGANGIKTGWTQAAGGCLAASAKRDGVELIAIVMRSADQDTRFDDAANMFDFGFERVRMVDAIHKDRSNKNVFVRGGKQATVRVGIDDDFSFPLMPGEDPKLLSVTYDLPRIVDAEIEAGKVLGTAVLRYDGKPVARVPLVAKEDVPRGFSFGSIIVAILSLVM
ncbi:MAG: D-alanyl-D-alanine carboxypeptidase [Quinella sp. 2Q5]|nr:D-alanyl-D-alanine carboxypeptidase [Quinella sp. 2Q5]